MKKKSIFAILSVPFVQCEPLFMNHQVQEDYVPILGYHIVGDTTTSLIITEEDYRDQVDYLTNTMNCNWITMKDLTTYITNKEKLPTNTCIMNFDDGTIDQYTRAFCSLNEHRVPATFYIITDDTGTTPYMSEEQIADLYDKGHDISSHTKSHPNLAQTPFNDQVDEIIESKTILEGFGYDVRTFAYPFGAFNDDTLDILRDSDYLLVRDTSQDNSWKDIRTPVISFNEDYKLHFFYIKPEGFSGRELAEKIQYTGWWQLEDNFKIISGTTDDIKIRSSSSFHPTSTSLAVLLMSSVGNEISTQFITKISSSVTLDILLSGPGVSGTFGLSVDGVEYTPSIFDENDNGRLFFVSNDGTREYYNYYVNIESLSSGVHTLNIVNTDGGSMILDKFRLWSEDNQDFSDPSAYNACNPSVDAFCTCDSVPSPSPSPSDPTCQNGIIGNSFINGVSIEGNICCTEECGECGGSSCSSNGPPSECCSGTIFSNGVSCDESSAPCVISVPGPTSDPTCEDGIIGNTFINGVFIEGNICCTEECGQCGGSSCSSNGPPSECCSGTIFSNGVSCDESSAPCVISVPEPTTTSDPTCELGIITQNICCSPECDFCGGIGCGELPQGGSNCCGGSIVASGVSCDDSLAPCVIGDPEPEPTTSDPTCELGIITQNICCSPECDFCGGTGCGGLPQGGSNCCGGPIVASGVSCDDSFAPCVIGGV